MFLSCGDALYDVFQTQNPTPTQTQLTAQIGGSPLNVALGLARLGQPVAFLCANSTDAFGEKIQQFLVSEQIDTQHVVRTDKNTSLAMVSVNEQGHPSYAFYIEGSADVSLTPSDMPDPNQFSAISLGSYATVVQPVAGALQALVAQAGPDTLIAYDPNVRPSIQPDPQVWWDAFDVLAKRADLIKLSDEDVEFLSPGASLEDFAAKALSYGPKWFVITRGGEGARVFGSQGQRIDCPGHAIKVADTVGAGDTFQAAMLDALQRHGWLSPQTIAQADMAQVVDWAIRAAAVTCTRVGADLPRFNDVQGFQG